MKNLWMVCFLMLNSKFVFAKDHQFTLQVPVQFIDYQLNKSTVGIGFQYQILLNKNLAPGIQISDEFGINTKTTIVPLYSIFLIKPNLTYYFKPEFKRFYFQLGLGIAFIREKKVSIPSNIYIPLKDQLHYSFAIGYQIPIKKWRLGLKSEIGGFFQPNASAPLALTYKNEINFSYCIFSKK